jgi:hypothetical protein
MSAPFVEGFSMADKSEVAALTELLRPLLDENADVPWGALAGGSLSYARWVAEQLMAAGVTVHSPAATAASG